MNTIGLIGFTVSVSAAFFLGMLVENFRTSIALRGKYKFRFKPRKVPEQEQEWGVQNKLQNMQNAPSDMFERACRKIVQENPGKFE